MYAVFLQFETGPISLWCLQALHILVNQSPSVCIYVCIFCVYNHVDCLTMTSRSRASLGGNLICRSPLIWHVLLFSLLFFLHVLTSEGGSVCLGVAILCTVMSFFGVHNELSKPFCLVFVSSCPSPPPPLLLFPPYRLCVCHICYQGNGTECNQNHASLSNYGGTVPLSTYFSFPSPPFPIHFAAPLCWKMRNLSKQMASIHHKAWVISKTTLANYKITLSSAE